MGVKVRTKTKLIVTGVAAVLAVSSGQVQAATKHPAGRHLNDPPAYDILKTCPRMDVRARVRINLDKSLDPKNPKRDIVDDDNQTHSIPKPSPPYEDATPLDIDLSSYLTHNESGIKTSAVRIRIVL